MWNMLSSNALGGPYDKKPGDRQEVQHGTGQTFEPIHLQIVVYDGKIQSFTSKGGRLASVRDSELALRIEQCVHANFAVKKQKTEIKKIDDGKTIDV